MTNSMIQSDASHHIGEQPTDDQVIEDHLYRFFIIEVHEQRVVDRQQTLQAAYDSGRTFGDTMVMEWKRTYGGFTDDIRRNQAENIFKIQQRLRDAEHEWEKRHHRAMYWNRRMRSTLEAFLKNRASLAHLEPTMDKAKRLLESFEKEEYDL